MSLVKIKDYNYFINDCGIVYNRKLKKLKQEKTKGGYLRVTLYKNGKPKHHLVHRLVAQTFLHNKQNLPEVNHLDNDPTNNKVENLSWCTAKENSRWSKSKQVKQIDVEYKKVIRLWKCIREASETLNIDNSSISRCCKGKQMTAGGYKWEYVEMSETSWKDKKGYEFND